ncbi:MAG: hypothetical protein R3253_17145, partial [Longimicrobiales bacterium]|nr:hypothetical protein [Longimicrobiales bacterium]
MREVRLPHTVHSRPPATRLFRRLGSVSLACAALSTGLATPALGQDAAADSVLREMQELQVEFEQYRE